MSGRVRRAVVAAAVVLGGLTMLFVPRHYSGELTLFRAGRLCVGRPHATGSCFLRSSAIPAELHDGDCVAVTHHWGLGAAGTNGHADSVRKTAGC